MTHELWRRKQKLNYSKDVLDIVQFGSSVIEGTEPRDIDIAVIFKDIKLRDQLNQSQKIKEQLKEKINSDDLKIHIKSFDLHSLFDASNFAREGILFYGKSLISRDYFSKRFGFDPKIQISYSLGKLEKKDKIKFHYMLKGKKGKYGLLRRYGGKLLNPGLIEISPEHEKLFVEKINRHINRSEIRKMKVLKIGDTSGLGFGKFPRKSGKSAQEIKRIS